MASLRSHIDDMCANLTQEDVYELVRPLLGVGSCTVDEIAGAVGEKDRSLDPGSARTLADAAVEWLYERREVTLRDGHVYPA